MIAESDVGLRVEHWRGDVDLRSDRGDMDLRLRSNVDVWSGHNVELRSDVDLWLGNKAQEVTRIVLWKDLSTMTNRGGSRRGISV